MSLARFPPLLALIGPTASGKTAVAIAIARLIGAEILSVDSMQVYRGMDIGTAKPTIAERQGVPHHLIDVAEPTEKFTVARFVAMADEVIADAAARGVPLIAAGGTPLYFKALFEGLFDGPAADPVLRDSLNEMSNEELSTRLSKIDPIAAGRIHRNDRKRLVRAIEVFELTGQPISEQQTEWASPQRRHEAVWIGVDWDKAELNRRINARAKRMVAEGWLDEIRRLVERQGGLSQTAGEAAGYQDLADHLAGRISLDEAIERIKISTRQLARRQMKWFRRFPNVRWFRDEPDVNRIAETAVGLWRLENVPRK